jgi:2-methylcitrate dehydratase PrpD
VTAALPGPGSATERLAAFSVSTRYEDLPDDVREMTRLLLVDSVACALGGTTVDKGRLAIEVARTFGHATECSVIGSPDRASAVAAAFANGELINALDMDAILVPGHISPYVIPAALGLAEARGGAGRELIRALAVAHEVGARVAAAYEPLRTLGGEPPHLRYELSAATGYGSSIIGAAAGAAVVLGFDVRRTRNCFGIAGYMTPVPGLGKYLRLTESPHVKYTSAGWVAAGAATAALLSERGYEGDPVVLDGEHGLWRMFASSGCDWDAMLAELGQTWRTLESELKPYPSFRMGHPGIEAFQRLLEQEALAPEEIERITVRVDPISMSPLYLNTRIGNHTDAQLSWAYVLGAAAYYVPGPRWQSREALGDPRIRRLMERVVVEPQTAWAGRLFDEVQSQAGVIATPFSIPVEVTVSARGRQYRAEPLPYPKGHPKRPMSRTEIAEKFIENADAVFDRQRAERLLRALLAIDTVEDSAPVLRQLGAG